MSETREEAVRELVRAANTMVQIELRLLPECPIVTHHRSDCPYCQTIAARQELQWAIKRAEEVQQ